MPPLLSRADDRNSSTTGTSTHNTISTISNGTAYFRPASLPDRDSSLPLRLLSIDGGGIHGYATLLHIQELMLSLFVEQHGRVPRPDELPRPCDHFDLIGGTGTGGLVALLLGRLRMDIETAKATYSRISRDSFRCENTLIGVPVKKTLFKATKFEGALRDAVAGALATPTGGGVSSFGGSRSGSSGTGGKGRPGRDNYQPMFKSVKNPTAVGKLGPQSGGSKRGDPDALLYDPSVERCRVFVTALHKGSSQLLLLRSYDAAGSRWRIWEAARATCAAPPMFKALTVESSVFLGDERSPVAAVVEEALGREFPGREVGVLVSIGSGTGSLEAEKSHLNLLRSGFVDPQNCYRLDSGPDSREYGVNEWDRYREISERVRNYTAQSDVRGMISDAARKMAGIAMMRAGETERGYRVMVFDRERGLPDMHKKSPGTRISEQTEYLGYYDEDEGVISDLEEDEEIMAHLEQLREITRRMYS